MILHVTHAVRDGGGVVYAVARTGLILLSLFANLDRVWAALPLISGANHFEPTDLPQ